MSSPASAVSTRLVDLSCLSLVDLQRLDDAQVSRVSEPLAREVSESAVVSLAGSDS